MVINFKNSDFCKLLRLPVSSILKIQKNPLGMLILRQKSFLISYPPFKNSTTRIAIVERKTDDAEWTVSNFSATSSTVLTWNQRPSYYTIIILIRISIEISMYLKIISISSLKQSRKTNMLDSATPAYPCLSLPTTSPQYTKNM